jgi:hypothetical protein
LMGNRQGGFFASIALPSAAAQVWQPQSGELARSA